MKKSRVYVGLLLSMLLTMMCFLPVAAQGNTRDANKDIRVEAKNKTQKTTVLTPTDMVRSTQTKGLSAEWPSFGGRSGAVNSRTARNEKEISLKWKYKAAAYGPSDVLLVNDHIYVAGDNMLSMLDKNGKTVKKVQLTHTVGYLARLAYGDGKIFVPVDNGQIQAFTADKLESVWVSDAIGTKQTVSTLTCSGGYVYTAITDADWSSTSNGEVICLNAATGDQVWSHAADAEGYYWSGAAVVGNAVIIGGDDGNLTALNAGTGAVISTVNVGARIRSTVVYNSGSLFFTTVDGKLHKVGVNNSGSLGAAHSVTVAAYSTSTPAIAQGKAFVGGSNADYSGSFSVVDTKSMTVVQSASAPSEVKSAPVVTTGYKGKLYAYATSNTNPGALYCLEYGSGQSALKAIYTPAAGDQNYCTSSPAADSDGTIYYGNDSGYLFALKGPGPEKDKTEDTADDKGTPDKGNKKPDDNSDIAGGDKNTNKAQNTDLPETKSKIPSTGDSGSPVYWLSMAAAAGCLLTAGLKRKRCSR